jgi:GTPase
MKKSTDNNKDLKQVAVLVGVDLPMRFGNMLGGEADLAELALLTNTAGATIVGTVHQSRQKPDAATFIGKGKLEELRGICAGTGANMVIFDNELSPAQGRNLEEALGHEEEKISVLDRTELILDIFASHAKTQQAKLQVELAQTQYMLPRLTKLWSHLDRHAGGIGTRGPGETQLETDRRIVGKRLARLKSDLKNIAGAHKVQTGRRKDQFKVALVGYTNAGKSTLMKAISGSDVFIQNKLFATLDATTRRVEIDERHQFLLTDTVGFIKRLPHNLVESFHATLQEVADANLLIHVVDASDKNPEKQISAVSEVLDGIVPEDHPTIMVFNKTDLLDDGQKQDVTTRLGAEYPGAVFISALDSNDPPRVRAAVEQILFAEEKIYKLQVPLFRMDLVAVFHRTGSVFEEEHNEKYCTVTVRLPEPELNKLLGKEAEIKVLD